jgi:pyruvate-ferredoxin/flavodoxin oxidoreductase
MTVMTEGFSRVQEIIYGEYDDPDRSSMRNPPVSPGRPAAHPHRRLRFGLRVRAAHARAADAALRLPDLAKFDSEFRNGLGYHQPAGALASLGVMGAGSGATQSKYVARRETPVYIAENCTQCMECITACPDTALPNTSQDVATVLKTAATYYVTDAAERTKLVAELKGLEQRARAKMNESIKAKSNVPFKDIIRDEVNALSNIAEPAKAQFSGIIDKLPIAYSNVPAIYRSLEQKTPGAGGLFSIFVSDLCKGCGECVQVCGDHDACA